MSNLDLIKDLRNKTGAGFLDCKLALSENNNNLDEAINFLRKKGLAKATKKSSREANEGAIGVYENDKVKVVIKINSETDFAAKSETFLNFIDFLGNAALSNNNYNISKEEFLEYDYKDKKISEYFTEMIAKIGENLVLSEIVFFDLNISKTSHYVHNSYKENIGKIVSILQFNSNKIDEKLSTDIKNICMHIAAMKPESLDIEDLDKNLIENEKNIQKDLIKSSGKPEAIIEKILDGKMKKFYSDITLLNQSFVIDPDKTVGDIINNYSSEYSLKIVTFKLFNLS